MEEGGRDTSQKIPTTKRLGRFRLPGAVLAGRDVFFVALHCDLAELARREAGRADRAAGDAARDAGVVHLGKRYDLELRGEDAAVVNAARVVEAWERRAGVSAFFG